MYKQRFCLITACLLAVAAAFMVPVFGGRSAVAAPADTDNDGLPDAWEIQYFGNLAQNDVGDYDSDGYSNLAEYNNGTDPSVAETLPPYLSTVQWTSVGPGGGGAQYNPAISPTDPNLMYGFCDMGGIYRSQDAGLHWQMYQFDQAQMPVAYSPYHCNPRFHPTNGDICYIGTQEGLKRTQDGGDTWEFLSSDDVPVAIAVNRSHPNIVMYANNANRMYLSTNSGDIWTEVGSWKSGINQTPIDIYMDASSPVDDLTIFVATGNGMYKSANNGSTWSAVNNGLPTVAVVDFDGGMKSGAPVLFATVSGGSNGVYRSTDRAATWVRRSQGINIAAGYLTQIGFCESNPDVGYATTHENGGPTIYKTTDAGDNWTMVLTNPGAGNFPAGVTVARDWMTLGFGWAWGEEAHEIGVSSSNPNYVAFAEDGRTWRSNDGGQSWFCCNSRETSLNSNWWPSMGFETTTNYRVHFAPWDSDRAYITYTDIGFCRSDDHAYSWRLAVQGSPYDNTFYDCAFDPTAAGKMWAVSSDNHDLPHEKMLRQGSFSTFTGAVLKSTTYGATWTSLGHPLGSDNNGAMTSIIVDPTSPAGNRTLWVAVMGKGVYKSTNDGDSWTAANTGLGMPSNMNAWQLRRMADGTLYCALTEAMNPSQQRFPGALFKSADGGATWTKVNTGQQFGYICGFDVDPTDHNVIYIANFNSGGDGLYGLWKTTNGGSTWSRTLAQGDTYGADIDPERHTRVYATIEQGERWWPSGGIYVSEDSGGTWTKIPGMPFERYGPNYTSFDPDNSEDVYVTTFGGGVWKATVVHADPPTALIAASPESGQFPLEVDFDSSGCTGDVTTHTWDFDDGTRSHAANPTHVFQTEGTFTVTLTVEGRNGTATTTATIEAVNVDSDGDGLPDWWEEEYFGDLDETADGDPDGDGITNIDEYNNGTDPTQEDTEPPVVSSLSTIPTEIRAGLDNQLTLNAMAKDVSTGNSRIAAAEYFIDVLGAAGTGLPMGATDGDFDESSESLTGSVYTGPWAIGTVTLYVRAQDALGLWSEAGEITVEVLDGAAPARVTDLQVTSTLKFEPLASQAWETAGTVLPENEIVTIDLGSSEIVGAVSMTPTRELTLFPSTFTIAGSEDGDEWTVLAKAVDYRAKAGKSLWMCAPAQYRYVRVTATGRRRSDGRYYVKAADVTVYETTDSNRLLATWRATADDGSNASSGPASEYDLRYGGLPISAGSFAASAQVASGVPVPSVKGTLETAEFSIGPLAGTVYVALKVGDEIPNWSTISNLASAEVQVTGLQPVSPEDAVSISPGTVGQFTYVRGGDVKRAVLAFSDRPDFPQRPIKNLDGTASKTIRFPLKPLMSWWKPSAGQWKSIKALANNTGAIYWRLEGNNRSYVNIAGPTRVILFDAGNITDVTVSNSHPLDAEEAIWPSLVTPPLFAWTNNTAGMRYFFVDVSTDPAIPLKDRKKTVTLGARGVLDGPYRATDPEWKKLRKLAMGADGTLYWRARALDADRVYACASEVKTLIVDGGTWTLDEIDMSESNPYVHWTHTAEGFVSYRLQFCIDDQFENVPRQLLWVPARSIVGDSYTLTGTEKALLIRFASDHGVSTLYWRVRGEDAQRIFVTYSEPEALDMP